MASNIQNTGTLTSTPSTGGTRSNVVRVFDIVLDANHTIFKDGNISFDPTLIGMIFYGDKDLDVTSTNPLNLPKALPKWGPQKIPLKYECVKIETGPSSDIYTDIGGNNSFNYVYYGEVVPVHGNAVHNALPSQKDLASTTPTSEESVLASNGTPNQSQPNEVSLDNTGNYQPKDDVRNLQPYAGDVIQEGRAGQTIRMGTTNKEGTNNWSDGDTFGDPVMILRVGQSENQQGSTVVEDVNGDASSIYMFANQKLNNIQLTTTNFESCQATYTEATVPTVQLAVAPILPPKPISNPVPEPFLETGPIIVEISPPQVTSSFSDDELEDPVFAALAEAEEEGLISLMETTYKFEETEPDIGALIVNTPTNYIPANAVDLDFNPGDDPSKILNPNRIGKSKPISGNSLYLKYKFGNEARNFTKSDVQGFINDGTLVAVGNSNTNPKKYSAYMKSAIVLDGIYYLHYACAPAFQSWMADLDANKIPYLITSAFRFSTRTGAGSHGLGIAVDFSNLYGLVNGSTSPIVNQKVRIEEPVYGQIFQLGIKHGWYNPWRLADGAGNVDEVWHFEYWGPV
jgi:hypothetical protein